jgi:hypothetical protein
MKLRDFLKEVKGTEKDITNYEGDEALEAVKEDGYALTYVKEQTPEICLAAVKEDGHALQYVKEQTPEICLAAVKEDGHALQYVKEQTPEICLTAVKEESYALKYVDKSIFEKDDRVKLTTENGETIYISKESLKELKKL